MDKYGPLRKRLCQVEGFTLECGRGDGPSVGAVNDLQGFCDFAVVTLQTTLQL